MAASGFGSRKWLARWMARPFKRSFGGIVVAVLVPIHLPHSAAAQEWPEGPLTLDRAVELALRNHPLVVRAEGDVDVEGAREREAVGAWLPTLSATSGLSRSSSTRYNSLTGQNVDVHSPFAYAAGLNASMVLFDGLQRIHERRAADAGSDRAEAALVHQRFQVTLLAKQAFYDVIHATELERMAESQVERARQQLDLSRERLAAGTVIRTDTLRATVERGDAELSLLAARAQRAAAEAALGRLIGAEEPVRVAIDSSLFAMPPIDTTAVRSEALTGSPAIASSQAEWRASSARLGVVRGDRFPRISASFSTARTGTAIAALNPSWSLGFFVSWSIFDGFTRDAGIAEALAEERTAEATATDAAREVSVRVTELLAALATARARLEIAMASREAGAEDLRVQQERYRQGVGTIVEVLTAQEGLHESEAAIVDARRAYQVAAASLEALIGREL